MNRLIRRKALDALAFGAGLTLIASIPFWGFIFKKGE